MQAAITPLSSYTYYSHQRLLTGRSFCLISYDHEIMQAEYMYRTDLTDDLAQI